MLGALSSSDKGSCSTSWRDTPSRCRCRRAPAQDVGLPAHDLGAYLVVVRRDLLVAFVRHRIVTHAAMRFVKRPAAFGSADRALPDARPNAATSRIDQTNLCSSRCCSSNSFLSVQAVVDGICSGRFSPGAIACLHSDRIGAADLDRGQGRAICRHCRACRRRRIPFSFGGEPTVCRSRPAKPAR